MQVDEESSSEESEEEVRKFIHNVARNIQLSPSRSRSFTLPAPLSCWKPVDIWRNIHFPGWITIGGPPRIGAYCLLLLSRSFVELKNESPSSE